jgi:hypothetical protein
LADLILHMPLRYAPSTWELQHLLLDALTLPWLSMYGCSVNLTLAVVMLSVAVMVTRCLAHTNTTAVMATVSEPLGVTVTTAEALAMPPAVTLTT